MVVVLRLPFDQKLLIRKQVQTGMSIYRQGVFPASPIRSSNRGILFMGRAIILLAIVCFHSVVGFALDHHQRISQYQHTA
jgi:hypothetical protein